jgi:hypothetical protein
MTYSTSVFGRIASQGLAMARLDALTEVLSKEKGSDHADNYSCK